MSETAMIDEVEPVPSETGFQFLTEDEFNEQLTELNELAQASVLVKDDFRTEWMTMMRLEFAKHCIDEQRSSLAQYKTLNELPEPDETDLDLELVEEEKHLEAFIQQEAGNLAALVEKRKALALGDSSSSEGSDIE